MKTYSLKIFWKDKDELLLVDHIWGEDKQTLVTLAHSRKTFQPLYEMVLCTYTLDHVESL